MKLIFFQNNKVIELIEKELPPYLQDKLEEDYGFKVSITIKKLGDSFIDCLGDSGQKISRDEIRFGGIKSVPLIFIEDAASADLTIKVGKKQVGTIKGMGRINKKIVKNLAHAIIEGIKK